MVRYLTTDDVLDLHTYAVLRYGGRLGIASHDRLMSVVTAPRQVLFEAELYPDVPSKAAALMFLMIKSRPFVSANKSTALLCMLRFLDLNEAALCNDVAEAELLWLVRSISNSDLDRSGVEHWLRQRLASFGVA
ncbi:MAG: Fic family protein [Roseiflexaceae bacterium]|nr:Fic family protein [Roseiflexaceae bacterium]